MWQVIVLAARYRIYGGLLGVAKRMKKRIKTATFFTTLLDFSQPGEVGAYINETIIDAIEKQNDAKGYMDGRSLSVTFSLLLARTACTGTTTLITTSKAAARWSSIPLY